jgi:c-di-GMP-related signal transduction protein
MKITNDEFELVISDKEQRINTFQPIVKDNNIKMFSVISLVKGCDVYSLSLSEKSIYLYELRTLIDSLSIIEKYNDSSFLIELTLSKKTVLNGMFIDYLLGKLNSSHIINRIVLNVFDDFNSTTDKGRVVKQLNEFKEFGYQVMLTSPNKGISFMFLGFSMDYLKVNLSTCSAKMKEKFIPFFLEQENKTSFIFSGIDTEADYDLAKSFGAEYLQGKHLGEGKPILMSGRYPIS